MSDFKRELTKRILLFDGAIGTTLASLNLSEQQFRGEQFKSHPIHLQGFYDLLNITAPELVMNVHNAYLQAGANIITTNSFLSNQHMLAYYKLPDKLIYDLNYRAALIAKNVVKEDKNHFIAGSIGPISLNKLNKNDTKDSCLQQATALLDGGVDILLVETVTNPISMLLALEAIDQLNNKIGFASALIVMISYPAINPPLPPVEWIKQFVESINSSGLKHLITALGINCVFNFDIISQQLDWLEANTAFILALSPSAGLPASTGSYPVKPEELAKRIALLESYRSLRILGGCCGTSPEHIRELKSVVAQSYDK